MFRFESENPVIRGIDSAKAGEDSVEGYVLSIQQRIEQQDEDRGMASVIAMGLQNLESAEVTTEQLSQLSSEQLARRIDYTKMAESVFSDPASSVEGFLQLQKRFERSYTLIDSYRESFLSSEKVSYEEFVQTIQDEHLLEESLDVMWDSLRRTLMETMKKNGTYVDLDQKMTVGIGETVSLRMMLENLSIFSTDSETWLQSKLDELEKDGFVQFELR